MAKVHHVTARKDYPQEGILKGEKYYWWKLNRWTSKVRSLTPPSEFDLISSSFEKEIYTIQTNFRSEVYGSFSISDLQTIRDETVESLNNLKEECQSSKDNLPPELQEVTSGEILTTRINSLENIISELENYELYEDDDLELLQIMFSGDIDFTIQ